MTRFYAYLKNRDKQDTHVRKLQKIMANENVLKGLMKEEAGKKKKDTKGLMKKNEGKNLAKKAKMDLTGQLPGIILWIGRFEMFFLVYMYHSPLSLIHISWLILTFLVSQTTIFLVSVYAMIPILSWEFVFVYGVRIPIIKDYMFMQKFGTYMKWPMEYKTEEQTFMFITLCTFFMMISGMRFLHLKVKEDHLMIFFRTRINDPRYSNNWKVLFYFLKYI